MPMESVLISKHVSTSILDRETSAAFCAASLQYSTASLGRNTGTKTVRTRTMSGVWLVGSFWHNFRPLYGKTSLFSRDKTCFFHIFLRRYTQLSTNPTCFSTVLQRCRGIVENPTSILPFRSPTLLVLVENFLLGYNKW